MEAMKDGVLVPKGPFQRRQLQAYKQRKKQLRMEYFKKREKSRALNLSFAICCGRLNHSSQWTNLQPGRLATKSASAKHLVQGIRELDRIWNLIQGPVKLDPTGKAFYVESPQEQLLRTITNKFGGSVP